MSRQTEIVERPTEFNYGQLEPKIAEQAKATAARVRETIRKGISVIIEVGQNLIVVKDQLSHGQFGEWLRMEFGWNRRSAENFMNVATSFGPKSEIISHLRIGPTVAYLLAAPSTPTAARNEAILFAKGGAKLTLASVREIVTRHQKKTQKRKEQTIPEHRLEQQLKLRLHDIRDRWDPEKLDQLADVLDNFVRTLRRAPKEKQPPKSR